MMISLCSAVTSVAICRCGITPGIFSRFPRELRKDLTLTAYIGTTPFFTNEASILIERLLVEEINREQSSFKTLCIPAYSCHRAKRALRPFGSRCPIGARQKRHRRGASSRGGAYYLS